MSEEEKKAIECGKELVDLYDRYGLSITYTEGGYDVIKTLLNLIEKQQHIIEGKDCVIETQAHNEEVLMDYFNRHTCLHCGKGKLGYCEECYQKLIAENAKLQEQIDLMASFIEVAELDEDILKTYCGVALNGTCKNPEDHSCKKCVKEHFKKEVNKDKLQTKNEEKPTYDQIDEKDIDKHVPRLDY